MMPTRKTDFVSALYVRYIRGWIGRNFKEVNILPFEPKEGHSVLLLCNHFSWWDGFLSNLTAVDSLKRRYHVMMQQDQFVKHWVFRFIGAYSIKKGSREMIASLQYSAKLLDDPRNMIVIFPQGELFSNHETNIHVEKGVFKLMEYIKGPCQIVYQAILIDYFESHKPRAYLHQFDCGVAGEITFAQLKQRINEFHLQALESQKVMKH